MKKQDIAQICHAANTELCKTLGDLSQTNWDDAPNWQKESAITGVQFNLDNPDAPASASHESWLAQKESDGWTYGEVKDAAAKTHPCIVPYDDLPPEQQAKDYLFKAIVGGLSKFISK